MGYLLPGQTETVSNGKSFLIYIHDQVTFKGGDEVSSVLCNVGGKEGEETAQLLVFLKALKHL